MRLQQGALLHLDICPLTGEAVLAWNEGSKVHICGYYYLMHLLSPSLESTREGVFVLLDAVEMSWKTFVSTFNIVSTKSWAGITPSRCSLS